MDEIAYIGRFPSLPEFREPLGHCVVVGEGKAELSTDGKPLFSWAFSECVGLLLRERGSLESALLHVRDLDLEKTQKLTVNEIVADYLATQNFDPQEQLSLISQLGNAENLSPSMREAFRQRMEYVNRERRLVSQFVLGSLASRNRRDRAEQYLMTRGISCEKDIIVDSGDQSWNLVYYPQTSTIAVDLELKKKVVLYHFNGRGGSC